MTTESLDDNKAFDSFLLISTRLAPSTQPECVSMTGKHVAKRASHSQTKQRNERLGKADISNHGSSINEISLDIFRVAGRVAIKYEHRR